MTVWDGDDALRCEHCWLGARSASVRPLHGVSHVWECVDPVASCMFNVGDEVRIFSKRKKSWIGTVCRRDLVVGTIALVDAREWLP